MHDLVDLKFLSGSLSEILRLSILFVDSEILRLSLLSSDDHFMDVVFLLDHGSVF